MTANDWVKLVCLAFGLHVVAGAEGCKDFLTVQSAIRNAQALDGTVVCIQGILRPKSYSTGSGWYLYEITSADKSTTGGSERRQAIGYIDWTSETGVDGALYKPESFDRLERLVESVLGKQQPSLTIEVVFRGTLMHGKDYFKKLDKVLPRGSVYDPYRGLSYSVELVLLEVVSAKLAAEK